MQNYFRTEFFPMLVVGPAKLKICKTKHTPPAMY